MTHTFSDNEAVNYPALGMCDICGVRFTHGCEHSNTLDVQEWLAAHIVAEQGLDVDESAVVSFVAAAEAGDQWIAEKTAEHSDWLDYNQTVQEALP